MLQGLHIVSAALEDDESKNNDGISFISSTGPAWAGTERDYTYDEVRQHRNETTQAIASVGLASIPSFKANMLQQQGGAPPKSGSV